MRERTLEQKQVYPAELVQWLAWRRARGGSWHLLTDRQAEVLALLAQGLDRRAIAGRLGLSVETVKSHLGKIFDHLGAHSQAQMVVKAVNLRLLDPQTCVSLDQKQRYHGLSPREKEVLRQLANGQDAGGNKQIASSLTVTGHTVDNHLNHIFDQLGVFSRVQAVLVYLAVNQVEER